MVTLGHGKSDVFGDYSGGNYTEMKTDGEVLLHGTSRVKRHRSIGASYWKPGVNAPTLAFLNTFPILKFSNAQLDSAHYSLIVPYRLAASTDIDIVVDWYHENADAGTVKWGMEYLSSIPPENPQVAGTTISKTTAGSHTADQLIRTVFTEKIIAANIAAHDILGLRFFRDKDNDTLGEAACLISVHFEFVMDKLGEAT